MTPLEAALSYANLGLRILPVQAAGKRPLVADWPNQATNNPDTINNWWTTWPDANIGIAMGPQPDGTNLFAVDVDQAGAPHLRDITRQHGQLPVTWESITGSRMRHYIYTTTPTAEIRNQQAAGNRLAPGIDIRGTGGQIVVYPSTHPNGNQYMWATGKAPWDIEPAPAPTWLLNIISAPPAPCCPKCGSHNTTTEAAP